MARESVWEKACNDLLLFLQKEIGIMRELLANMHQEELLLLNRDREGWNKIMQERGVMIQLLGSLREERLEVAKRLQEIAIHHNKEFSAENLLPDGEESCAFLSLRDQMAALMDKMNLQKSRNTKLLEEWDQRQSIHSQQKVVPFSAAPKLKAKISLATKEKESYLDSDEENLGA